MSACMYVCIRNYVSKYYACMHACIYLSILYVSRFTCMYVSRFI